MSITVAGANHRTAPIEIRERLHVSERGLEETVQGLLGAPAVEECVVLSTCNRTELYLRSETPEGGREAAELTLARHAGLTQPEVASHLYLHHERDAVMHLFRVVSGLDSLVIGEPQIQGQVGDAYQALRDLRPEAVGPVMHRLFQSALSAGGQVRSETHVSEGAASVPAAAVELTTKIFGALEGRKAMVIGAGEMGELTLSTLRDRGVEETLVASRTLERAEETADRVGSRPVEYEAFWELVPEIDIVVSSTAAPHPMITVEKLRPLLAGRDDALVIVDIALPRDVEPAVGELNGVFLYNIDDLQRVVRATERNRSAERESAERLLAEALEDFWSWYRAREAAPIIRQVRERAERIRSREIEEALADVEGLSEEEKDRIHRASRLALKKVLHAPTVGLRDLAKEPEGTMMLEVARRLFRVGRGFGHGDGQGDEAEGG